MSHPQEHTQDWPAHLAFLACQSSCSEKEHFLFTLFGELQGQ